MSESNSRKKVKAILIDDEEAARQRLRKLLLPYTSWLEIIAEAQDGEEALLKINQLKPDIIFLDIEMPGKNGLQVVKELQHFPHIIFVTAYKQYALNAFEENSLDYLLKPVETDRLAITMQRIQERTKEISLPQLELQQLFEKLQPRKVLTIIPVKTGDRIQLIPVHDIVFLEAKDKYVNLQTEDKIYLLDHSLAYLEEQLPEFFIRVQRAYIINQNKIRDIRKYFNGGFIFEMADAENTKIKSGNTYNESLRKLFEL